MNQKAMIHAMYARLAEKFAKNYDGLKELKEKMKADGRMATAKLFEEKFHKIMCDYGEGQELQEDLNYYESLWL